MSDSTQSPPASVMISRGELDDGAVGAGHTLVWLWPEQGPASPQNRYIHTVDGELRALELLPGMTLTVRRGLEPAPALTPAQGGWLLTVPSSAQFQDVSRSPTRLTSRLDGELMLESEAQGPQRLWIDLCPLDGPCAATPLPPWSVLAMGPILLWFVPRDLAQASLACTPADGPQAGGFRCYARSTAQVVESLRRRAELRVQVPRAATAARWEARLPFILVGEPGCGKTTLAKAVYAGGGARRFAAVHPVAVEQEVDLVALTGCVDFAHDGVRVPDQPGHLDVATDEQGVVLIDEVHTLDERLKRQLIDLLTEWTFRPRGDTTRRKKIRGLLVFATNQPELLRDPARFPQDLFARMGGEASIIEVPPLRQRRWEVPRLAQAVLDEISPPLPLSALARRKLLLHAWPLNHWELEDVLREGHSLALSQGAPEIGPRHLKLQPRDVTAQPRGAGPAPAQAPVDGATLTIPDGASWVELLQAVHHLGSFQRLRDSWQRQLGAKNAAAVNRRIGRAVRCDRCEPGSCPRCFVGQLVQRSPEQLLARLQGLAPFDGPPEKARAWLARALDELVVQRLEPLRDDAVRAAAGRALEQAGEAELTALLGAMRQRLADGGG